MICISSLLARIARSRSIVSQLGQLVENLLTLRPVSRWSCVDNSLRLDRVSRTSPSGHRALRRFAARIS
jgi:hypothetical protein